MTQKRKRTSYLDMWLGARIMLVVLACMTVVFILLSMHSLDGPMGALSTLIPADATIYAEGYSDRAFRKIEPGMTPHEVEHLLGRPLDEYDLPPPRQGMVWEYTRQANHVTSFRVRSIVFVNGTVQNAHASFFVE